MTYKTRGEAVKNLRKRAGMSQEALANLLGTTKQTIYKYEMGIVTNIPSDKIEAMAQIFHVSPGIIMGWESDPGYHDSDLKRISHGRPLRILGEICCGNGGFDDEEDRGYFVLDESIKADYALHVRGNSMIDAGIEDGDTILLKEFAGPVTNGKIYAVRMLAEELSFLKKVYQNGPAFTLVACNPSIPPVSADYTEIKIVGEYVGVYKPAR